MNVRRRAFLAAALALPFGTVWAQAIKKPWRIGYVGVGPQVTPENLKSRPTLHGLILGMREMGYVEGVDFRMEWRVTGNISYAGIDRLAADLVAAGVDMIVANNPNGTRAAQKATTSIPILFFSGSPDPVASGFVSSLSRPGGNITGFYNRAGDLLPKQMDVLRALVPNLGRVAVLVNPENPAHPGFVETIRAAAKAAKVLVIPVSVADAKRFDGAFSEMVKQNVQGMISLGDTAFLLSRHQIIELARRHRLPAIYVNKEFAEDGGLMQYGWDALQDSKRVATYVRKILQDGEKPANLPVQQSDTVRLVLNRKAARETGITFPQELLLRADEVIE